jgi:hypothetical protein
MTDLKYSIAVDAAQADAELARLHQSATTLAGAEDKLAASTTAATKALTKQGAAATTTASFTEKLQKQAGKLPDILGKQAAAISLVSSSLDGMGGSVGKAVAGAGQIAAAFGAGGPFAALLVGGIAVIDAVTAAATRSLDETDKAFDRFYSNMDKAAIALAEQRRLVKAAADAGMPAEVLAAKGVKERKAEQQAEIDAIKKSMSVSSTAEERAANAVAIRNRERAIELIDEETKRLQSNKNAQESVAFRIKYLADQEEKKTKAIQAGKKAREEQQRADEDYVNRALNAETEQEDRNRRRVESHQAMLDDIRKADADARAAKQAEDDAYERADIEREQRILDVKEAFIAQNRQQAEQDRDELLAVQDEYAQAAISIFASSSVQLMADLIGGQEKAFEKMGANILAQSGTFVVGKGIEAAADGASRLVRGDVSGAVPLAGGLALVGLGASMGGIGAAWATQLGGGGAAGGDRGPSSRGIPSGPSMAGNGMTSNNVTIVYAGASGPTADHGARAVTDAQQRANDRQLRRPEVR